MVWKARCGRLMTTETIIFIGAVLHLLICIIFLILIKTDLFKISMQLYPMILLLPVAGAVMAMYAQHYTVKNMTGSKTIELERLALEQNDIRRISMEEDRSEKSVVPLEEAILINDHETRRKLIISIIQQDPAHYLKMLQRATLNDDIEVTHYASTAIMEIRRNYELEISEWEQQALADEQDAKALDECLNALSRYIKSGLLEDNLMNVQRLRYKELLMKRLALPDAGRETYHELADNLIELENFSLAQGIIDEAMKKWYGDESFWLLRIKLYERLNDGEMIKKTISEMKQARVYISPSANDKIKFWNR